MLIYDLGGGTFDVSILTIKDGVFKVRSTTGNTHLGGGDFDSRLVNHFVEEIKRKHSKDVSANKNALCELRIACEKAKRLLTSNHLANIGLQLDGLPFKSSITRARFEELNADLFQSTIDLVEKAIEDAEMTKSDIQDVVLVGGSTRIPKIQKMVQEFFNGMDIIRSINPDEAVAYGATIHAAILQGNQSDVIKNLSLFDVTPLSLGFGIRGGIADTIIKRNTTIPIEITKTYITTEDDQKSVTIRVFEGERLMTKDNNILGVFTLEGVPPAPRGVGQVDVTFEVELVRLTEQLQSLLILDCCDIMTYIY